MKKIESQLDFENFILSFDWHDSFIRELYLVSPSYVNKEVSGVVAPDQKPSCKILICNNDENFAGIELIFEGIDNIYINTNSELNPIGNYNDECIEISLTNNENEMMQVRNIWYKILNNECWGYKTMYSDENMYNEQGFFMSMNKNI